MFGVNHSGRPSMPNSRRQLAIGGGICLAIWPGMGLLLLAAGQLDRSEYIFSIVSPGLLITALGVYLLGQSILADREHPRFQKQQKRHANKEHKQ